MSLTRATTDCYVRTEAKETLREALKQSLEDKHTDELEMLELERREAILNAQYEASWARYDRGRDDPEPLETIPEPESFYDWQDLDY